MKHLRILLLLLTALLFFTHSANSQTEKKNVLLIIADDFNHWLNKIDYYPQSLTPNLDKLADRGVLFSKAYSSSPICNPSRNAFMSGLRPSTTGISGNEDGYFRDKVGFENAKSMNQYFTEKGYYTHAVGKIYHPGLMGDHDTDPGNWSDINTNYSGGLGGEYYSWESPSNSEGGLWEWNAGVYDLNTSPDTKNAISIASKISGYQDSYHADKPFFIACGLFRPHLPWLCHKQFYDLFLPDTLNRPRGFLEGDTDDIPGTYPQTVYNEIESANLWQDAIRAYLANLAYADYNAGIILESLENSQYKDNTIVVFFGDHGWHLGEKERYSKYTLYEQASHTTLIIYDPSAEGNGQISAKTVSLQDIYPTLVSLTGIPENENIEGRDISPLLDTPNDESWKGEAMMTLWGTNFICTDEYWFVDNASNSQLYNLETDPDCFTNLYQEPGHETIVNELKTKIDSTLEFGRTFEDIHQYDGYFYIENQAFKGKYLEIFTPDGGLSLSETKSDNGKWAFQKITDSTYLIKNKAFPDYFLSSDDGATNYSLSDTMLERCKWKIIKSSGDWFKLENLLYSENFKAVDELSFDLTNDYGYKVLWREELAEPLDEAQYYFIENKDNPGYNFVFNDHSGTFALEQDSTDKALWEVLKVNTGGIAIRNRLNANAYLTAENGNSPLSLTSGIDYNSSWSIERMDQEWSQFVNKASNNNLTVIDTANFDLTSETEKQALWKLSLKPSQKIEIPSSVEQSFTLFERNYLVSNIISENKLHLDLTYADPMVRLVIYDVQGKQMHSGSVPGEQEVTLILPELVSGIYFLGIKTGRGMKVEKFMVIN